jgi:hypothetical protein
LKSFQQIWKQMDATRRRQAADALYAGKEYVGEQQRSVGVIAAKLNLRAQKAAKLPPEKLAGYLVSMVTPDEQLAGALVRAYLFGPHQAMLVSFLDELQIPHEKGAISIEEVPPPSADALRAAVEKIRASFDATDVDIYLSALLASDAGTWVNLENAGSAQTQSE